MARGGIEPLTRAFSCRFSQKRFLPPPRCLDGTQFCKKSPLSGDAANPLSDHACLMLTAIYVEALLVDEDLADQVWELWIAGLIPDDVAALAWCILALM